MRKDIMPQVPDYFGFLLGFLFIWLIYTGFSAVKGVFVQTHSKAIEYTSNAKTVTTESVVALHGQAHELMKSNTELVDKAKDKVEELQIKLENSRARLAEPKAETPKSKNWSSEQLRKANLFINDLIATIGESIYGSAEEDISEPNPIQKEVVKKNDSLEWFQ